MRPAIALLVWLLAPAVTSAQTAPTKTRAALTALYSRALAALQSRDTTALTGIYASNYRFTLAGGDSIINLSRAERLASIAASGDSIRTLNLETCDFDLFPRFAIGGCWIRQRGVATSAGDWTGIYTTVIFTQDAQGRWWIVRNHSSVNRVQRRRP